ncbi:MAG TPA: VOC family protein [Thermoleophilaceae bacterium]
MRRATTPARISIDELVVAAEPAAWQRAGFAVADRIAEVGTVRVRLAGSDAGRGLVSWSLRGADPTQLDGLPTEPSERPPVAGPRHPNGVVSVDHVVVFSPNLDRTAAALQEAGLDLRRIREEPTPAGAPRQAFFRLGEVILEVIQAPDGSPLLADPEGPARLWGISFLVDDLGATAEALGDQLGDPRDAVQAGRTIATARREAELGLAVAFMTPAA